MSKLTYHELTRSERDFLAAVANTPADASGQKCADYVNDLRVDERPAHDTIYRVLPELVAYGLVHKVDEHGTSGQSHAYQLTEDGYQVLRDASDTLAP